MTDCQAVPLPRLALCPECDEEVQVRVDRRLRKHDQRHNPGAPIIVGNDGFAVTDCPGSQSLAREALEPTFVRWLWMQSKRRDDSVNLLTRFAAFQFRGCTRAPRLSAHDMTWTTPEELHGQLHLRQLIRTGSADRSPGKGYCDWLCRDLLIVAKVHQQLIAEQNVETEKRSA